VVRNAFFWCHEAQRQEAILTCLPDEETVGEEKRGASSRQGILGKPVQVAG
jgi:hypothetical protein